VAKLADAPGLGPGPERGGGSSPLARTTTTPDPTRGHEQFIRVRASIPYHHLTVMLTGTHRGLRRGPK
jgi:hypothetical protein